MRLSLVLLLALGGAGVARADIDWTKPPPLFPEASYTPPRPQRLLLANGAALLVIENHQLPLATVRLIMPGAGAAADPVGQAGLAGYTADLLDEGAGGLGALELARHLEALGSTLSTWADGDAAYVQAESLTRNLDQTVAILASVLTAPAFDARDGQRVHEDRLTDIALRRDRPGAVAMVALLATLYGAEGPYGHPELGYARDLGRITVADAHAFYRSHYDPSRLVIVVAGDVDAQQIRKLLEAEIGAWRPHAVVAPPSVLPMAPRAPAGSRLLVVDRPGAAQTSIRVGVVAMPRGDERAYALEVAATILGGSFTSRLNKRLREELGYTYGAFCAAGYQRRTGHLTVQTDVESDKTMPALAELLKILDDLAKNPVSDDELHAAQQNLTRQLPRFFLTNGDIVDAFGSLVLFGLPDEWFATFAARIDAVTPAEVRAATALLAGKNAVFVLVGDRKALTGVAKLGLGAPRAIDADGAPVAAKKGGR